MKTIKTITTALMFMALSTAASAVEFTLPSGPDVSLAQIQSLNDFTTICDSNTATDSVCEVPAGEYQLVVFDAVWASTISTITVAPVASTTPDAEPDLFMTTTTTGSRITLVTQNCFGGPNSRMGCTASCPAGTEATGGACYVPAGFEVKSVAEARAYRCPALLPPNQTEIGVIASVYCLNVE